MKTLLLVASLLVLPVVSGASEAELLIAKGDELDRQFKADEALKYYLPAEKLTPDDPALLVKIARQYVFRMDYLSSDQEKLVSVRTGLQYAERAVKLAPKECDPHLAVAICLGKMTPLLGSRERVEVSRKIKEQAEIAVKLDPKNDYAWHMLGRWHQAMANIGGVVRGIALVVYGGLPEASLQEAERCLKKAQSLNPNRLIHQIELGRTYAMLGRDAEARKLIESGLSMPNKEKDDAETKARGRETLKELN